MITKGELVFDPAATADSDNVGAYVRAGTDGALIDSQLVNSQEWLNTAAILYDDTGAAINDANPLPVDVKSSITVDVNLSHLNDSVRLGDGTNFLTSTTVGADIGLDVNIINASLTVTATDLDIRNLSAAQDNVAISDGVDTLAINADGSLNAVVSATNLDIRDLTHVSDSVKLGDGTNLFTSTTVGADIGLDVNIINASLDVQDLANSSLKTTAKSATTTQSALLTAPLANRKYLYVQNLGNRHVYIAESGATDAAVTGLRLPPGAIAEFRFGPSATLDIKANAGTQDVRVLEAA